MTSEAGAEGLENADTVKTKRDLAPVDAAGVGALRAQIEALKMENARLAEAVAARDGFLAVAAHELLNGVSPIVGRIDILRRKIGQLTPERALADLNQIAALNVMFTKRARTLLDISRLNSGVMRVDRVAVDGNTVATRIVDGFQAVAELAGSEVNLTLIDENILLGHGRASKGIFVSKSGYDVLH